MIATTIITAFWGLCHEDAFPVYSLLVQWSPRSLLSNWSYSLLVFCQKLYKISHQNIAMAGRKKKKKKKGVFQTNEILFQSILLTYGLMNLSELIMFWFTSHNGSISAPHIRLKRQYEITYCQWIPKTFSFEQKMYQDRLIRSGKIALKRHILRGIFLNIQLCHIVEKQE